MIVTNHNIKRNLLITGLLLFALIITESCSEQPIKTYPVEQGNFKQSFIETGELAAVNTSAFILPRYGRRWYQMKIIGLVEHGTEVKAGDSIIQLDPSVINTQILDLEQELETEQAHLEKLQIKQANSKGEIETTLKTEEASFELKKLSMEQAKFESEKNRKVLELQFEQSKIQYNNTQKKIITNQVIADMDLKIQAIKVRQIKEEIKNSKDVLPELTIRTPIPGIFQVALNRQSSSSSRQLIKVGDEIYYNTLLGNVPDLTWMKVLTTVNETDVFKISVGQPVRVRLDALPSVAFQGEIASISKLCHVKEYNSRQKVFDVEVKMLVSDKRLKPGMTVSTEFVCKEIPNVLSVPNSCVEETASGSYVYVKKGNNFERVEVEAGPSNNTRIVIKGDIQKGQLVAPVSQVEHKKDA